ncbi:PKD domain-containing protein [Polluticoccus soli]|uniref:PKD domain-containing protein n=1 Tax=Polluticoccus soli TaxID=3034150 RepID=UPI0023E27BA6|nr:PKD domain-containing protein [Flavipsychrobacter sp. JY13-12]
MRNHYNPFLRGLKKLLPLAVTALIGSGTANAQVPPNATQYLFSAYQEPYAPITGTQVTNVEGDDANQPNIPIGFAFPFCTGTYSMLNACSNGFLALSNISTNTLSNTASEAGNYGPMMMPLWDDLNGSPNGDAFYQTTGTAPNRVFTFEWRSWRWTWSAAGNNIVSFQVKLFESGRIEYHYNEGPDPVGGSPSATIGIARNSTDYQTLTNTTTSPGISTATFIDNLTIRPISGQVYCWDKPLPNNAGIFAISEPTSAICLGTHTVKAQMKNFGGNTISNVTINWSINGIMQPAIPFSTPIPVGGSSGLITLGNVNFPTSSTTLKIQAWTSSPNGGTDPEPGNDSFAVSRKALDPPGAIVYYETSRVCPGDSVMLYAPTGPNFTYQWELDATPIPGGTASSYYAKQDGFYSVTINNPGCKAQSVFHKITVKPLSVELGPNLITCETIPPIEIDAGEPGARYVWSTGDTTQTIPVGEGYNKYWVEVTLGQMCKASDTIESTIEPLPDINGISFVNVGNTYFFAPGGPTNVASYLWSFGDGATDTVANPIHTYAIPGPYNVSLTVYNSCGEDTAKISDLPVKVDDITGAQMAIYPNPANDVVYIQTTDAYRINSIKVFNTLGAVVKELKIEREKLVTVDIHNLPPGSYNLLINTDSGVASKLFQVVR